jgi:hypothetical protein
MAPVNDAQPVVVRRRVRSAVVLRVPVVLSIKVVAIRLPLLVLVAAMMALLPSRVPAVRIVRGIVSIMPATMAPMAVRMPAMMLAVIAPVTKMPTIIAGVTHCRRG